MDPKIFRTFINAERMQKGIFSYCLKIPLKEIYYFHGLDRYAYCKCFSSVVCIWIGSRIVCSLFATKYKCFYAINSRSPLKTLKPRNFVIVVDEGHASSKNELPNVVFPLFYNHSVKLCILQQFFAG